MYVDDLLYVASRGLSVAVRPLVLYWIIYNGLENQSIQLALIYTLTTSVTYLLFIEVHKNYYRKIFSIEAVNRHSIWTTKLFIEYVLSVLRMGIFGSIVGFISWYLLVGEILTSILLSLVIALDWFTSEYLRYLIFAKKFRAWSIIQTIRYTLPGLILILSVPLISTEVVKIYLGSYVVCLLALNIRLLKDSNIFRLWKNNVIKLNNITVKSIIFEFKNRLAYVAAAFSNRHTILMDRYIIYFLDSTFFTFYTLISLFLNIIPMFVDMFYVARNRARFAQRNIPIFTIFKEKHFVFTSFGSAFVAALAVTTAILTQGDNETFLYIQSSILLFSFFCFSVSSPIYELIFWHKSIRERLMIETSYCLLLSFGGLMVFFLNLSITTFLIFMLVLHLIRLLSLCYTLQFTKVSSG